jgi:DNA-binding NarL/FixJ family response regulator
LNAPYRAFTHALQRIVIKSARVIFSYARMESFATHQVKKNALLFMNCLNTALPKHFGKTRHSLPLGLGRYYHASMPNGGGRSTRRGCRTSILVVKFLSSIITLKTSAHYQIKSRLLRSKRIHTSITMSQKGPINILLVDDQPAKLLTYEVILSELGENLIKAESAREALEYLLKTDIAVILIDVVMPDLDGFELAAMIRAHPRFQKIAIMFVSAQALSDIDRLKACEHGAVDYVPIPVVPELLRAKVRVFAELYRKAQELQVLNAELERRVKERTAELAHANAVLGQRVEEYRLEREAGLVQVPKMQNLETLGQLTINLKVAVAANEAVLAYGTFTPASSLPLGPAPDSNEPMQQPEPGSCGLEYSQSSPEQCIGETPDGSEAAGGSEITPRELEVLASLAKGKSNKMIARELDLREGTVKVHVRSLLKKLNATNRTQLALRAYFALDTALAVRGGRLAILADPAAAQGSTDT